MHLKSLGLLRTLDTVARCLNLGVASKQLNLTKGAVSYQLKKLEDELGFAVLNRDAGKLSLTNQGEKLWRASLQAIEKLDTEISEIRQAHSSAITVGMSTYFASRWLSPRLMRFTSANPDIQLRIQPVAGTIDVHQEGIDMAIRWGYGQWQDCRTEQLFRCPAFATANPDLAEEIVARGLEQGLANAALLHDLEDSESWKQWYNAAGLDYRDSDMRLVIPDPNVRVQAVIDGQGLALNDRLLMQELQNGQLVQLSDVTLDHYGYYLALPNEVPINSAMDSFCTWLREEAAKPD